METKEDNERLHLIRNDNGEWISDEYAVILSKFWAKMLRSIAAKKGKNYIYSMAQMVFSGVTEKNGRNMQSITIRRAI